MIKGSKYYKNKKSTIGTAAIAALVGGLAGAVVSLVFAPKCGKELRQGIREKADNVIERVEDVTFNRAGALKQQGTDLVDRGKQFAEDFQTFIQESLKKKSDTISIDDANNTQIDVSLEPPTETTPEILDKPEDPPKEHEWGTIGP